MSDEYRPIEVVQVGGGPPRPPKPSWRPPGAQRQVSRIELMLLLLVVGVFVAAGCSALAAWTVRDTQQDNRLLNCMYVSLDLTGTEDSPSYDDLPKQQQKLVDRFDCDIPGR